MAGGDDRLASIDGQPADALDGEDPLPRARPVDGGDVQAAVGCEVFGQLGRGGRLHPQVHLVAHQFREKGDEIDEAKPLQVGSKPFDALRQPEEEVEVAAKCALDPGPEHLDRHRPTVAGFGEVDLGDGGGGHRDIVEATKENVRRLLQLLFDDPPGDGSLERRQPVAQVSQIGGEIVAENVGAGGQRLPQLDERRAGGLQGTGELLPQPSLATAGNGPQSLHHRPRRIERLDRRQRVVSRQDRHQSEHARKVAAGPKHGYRATAPLPQIRQAEWSAAIPPDRLR